MTINRKYFNLIYITVFTMITFISISSSNDVHFVIYEVGFPFKFYEYRLVGDPHQFSSYVKSFGDAFFDLLPLALNYIFCVFLCNYLLKAIKKIKSYLQKSS